MVYYSSVITLYIKYIFQLISIKKFSYQCDNTHKSQYLSYLMLCQNIHITWNDKPEKWMSLKR